MIHADKDEMTPLPFANSVDWGACVLIYRLPFDFFMMSAQEHGPGKENKHSLPAQTAHDRRARQRACRELYAEHFAQALMGRTIVTEMAMLARPRSDTLALGGSSVSGRGASAVPATEPDNPYSVLHGSSLWSRSWPARAPPKPVH